MAASILLPRAEATTMAMIRSGNERKTSVIRITISSNQPPYEAGEHANDGPADSRYQDHQEADAQAYAASVEDTAEDIAAELVRS